MHVPQKLSLILTFAAALAFAGCGKDEPTKGGAKGVPEDDHHKPPNGGEVLELGVEEGHLEVMHDHDGGHITVWVFGSDFKKPLSVERPTVMIQTKAGPARPRSCSRPWTPRPTARHTSGRARATTSRSIPGTAASA